MFLLLKHYKFSNLDGVEGSPQIYTSCQACIKYS